MLATAVYFGVCSNVIVAAAIKNVAMIAKISPQVASTNGHRLAKDRSQRDRRPLFRISVRVGPGRLILLVVVVDNTRHFNTLRRPR